MGKTDLLVPAALLEVDHDQLSIVFGTSPDNSDFIADVLETWWADRGQHHPSVTKLLINLDNAPEINSSRTQFMNRLVQFSDRTQLTVELAYYPPYHSKYNPVERCWGILENHWNGTLLTSLETALQWAKSMRWRSVAPIIHLLERTYQAGVTLTKEAFRPIANRLNRSSTLPKWSLTIQPIPR